MTPMTPAAVDHLRQLYTQYERIQAASPDVRREVLPNLIRLIPVEAGDSGAVIYSRLDETNADAETWQPVTPEAMTYATNACLK